MIRVTVMYPNGGNTTFDMGYYTTKHLPMVKRKCGMACKSIGADRGLNAGQPGTQAPYVAVGYLTFDSLEEFQKSFGPHAAEILADIPNYTNAQPVIQISDVAL
ncbi:MAG TPA: EthD family reductase [Steroidobacteraceae bacterium]|nr:EthD family reductase [Steroidobacteraceae bacterium]